MCYLEPCFGVQLPLVVDLCRGRTSPLTGKPVIVVGAGGIVDGRGLAMTLTMGCGGAWVGTRFVSYPLLAKPKHDSCFSTPKLI